MAMPSQPVGRGSRPSRPSTGARSSVAALGALVVVAAALVTGSPGASGQAVDTAVRAVGGSEPPLLAQVTPDPLDPPQIQVSGVWMADGSGAATGVATAYVVFETEFEVPRQPWRVAVSVGDPRGQRVRSSLVSVGSAGLSGRVEEGDGVQWDDAGPTEVAAAGGGVVTIGVPVSAATDGAVLWVEAEATVDGAIEVSRTPTFAVVDLLGERPGPSLGTSSFAAVPDEPEAEPVAVVSPGPTVQVVGRALEVTTVAVPPTEVDGVRVVDVIDTVTIGETGSELMAGRLEIDRRTGEVRLATAGAEPFVAVPGTTSWLVNPPSPTAPGAPVTVTFDLEALNQAIGGPAFDRATTRVGVSRTMALDDRRILETAGVGGTINWFDESLTAPAAAAAPTGTSDGVPALVWVLFAAVVVVVVAVMAFFIRRRKLGEPRPIDRFDSAPALVAAGVPPLAVRAVSSGSDPGVAPESAPPGVVAVKGGTETVMAAALAVSDAALTASREPESADPLAAFLAEVDELSARVDRLGSPVDPASARTIPAGEGAERPR